MKKIIATSTLALAFAATAWVGCKTEQIDTTGAGGTGGETTSPTTSTYSPTTSTATGGYGGGGGEGGGLQPPSYELTEVDVSAFADGGTHELAFHSTTYADADGVTNFFVDFVGFVCDGGGGNGGAGGSPACSPVADPSFEGGTPSSDWDEASSNYGTPLCDESCCPGGECGPHEGDWWAWFGGHSSGEEEGSVSQDLTIDANATHLTFYLAIPVCDTDKDYLEVTIDGERVFCTDGNSVLCGGDGSPGEGCSPGSGGGGAGGAAGAGGASGGGGGAGGS